MTILTHTPLYLNFTNLVETDLPLLQTDPSITPRPPLPSLTDPNYTNLIKEYNEFTRPDTILSPRFYLKIFPPGNLNYGSGLDPITINIPRQGTLANQLRLKLKPSCGYGVNSCYRIEYWKWYPFIPGFTKGKENEKQRRITQELIRQEYWLIPAVDGRTWGFFGLHPDRSLYIYPIRRRALTSQEISVIRKYANPTALESSPAYSDVRDYFTNPIPLSIAPIFYSSPSTPFDVVEAYNTPDVSKPYDKYITDLYIEYKGTTLLPGGEKPIERNGSIEVKYRLNYIQPVSVSDVLFLDYEEEKDYTKVNQYYREVPRTLYDIQF